MVDDQRDNGPELPLEDVKERVAEIQRRHRGKIRWRITKHTAEIAIRVIESGQPGRHALSRSGKTRRRKRFKRLL